MAFEHNTTAMAEARPRGLWDDDMGVLRMQSRLDLTLFDAYQRPVHVKP